MKKHLLILITAVMLISMPALLNAQYDVPANFATVVEAINAIKAATDVAEATINVAEGVFLEPTHYNGQAGRPMKITIQGAGADKTILKGFEDNDMPLPGEIKGHRFLRVDRAADDGTEFVVRDLTIKNFGYGDMNGGGVVNMVNTGATVVVNFTNVNFENNLARRGAIAQVYFPNKTLTFDNCSFFNNTSFDNGSIAGLIYVDGGNLLVMNSTFMSNNIDPRDVALVDGEPGLIDKNRKAGGIITLETSTRGNVVAVLENNIFVNNLTNSDSVNYFHPALSVKANSTELTLDVSLIANVAIGNRKPGRSTDIDLYYTESNLLTFTLEGNIMNSVIKRVVDGENITEVPAVIDGIRINEAYTYEHSWIAFNMDGALPKVLVDEFGVKYVEYTGDGGFNTGIISPDNNTVNIYSYKQNLIVNGLQKGEFLEIYTITGSSFLKQKTTESQVSLQMPKGLYIVKAGSTVRKILIQ
jgi:hypothetical protein